MTTNYPASLDNFVNPAGTATLASPDHAGQHSDINDAVEALQAKVGVDSSAVTTSLDYKVAQKIDKTLVDAKGDLIVASAADTVGRLAVGATNGHVLTVDSAQSLGVKWAAAAGRTSLGWQSAAYYAPFRTQTNNFTLVEDVTYYQAVLIQEDITIDRLCVYASGFSGTSATVRLGIYNNSGGKPTTVLLDAGTVAITANTTLYTITVNQTLTAGWYWTAINAQTIVAGTTAAVRGATSFYREGLTRVGTDADINNRDNYNETGITGAFATAGTLVAQTPPAPMVYFRAA